VKLIFLILFSTTLLVNADSARFKFQADQAYADGFYQIAWSYYKKSFLAAPSKDQASLVVGLCNSSVKAEKFKEGLSLINQYVAKLSSKEIDAVTLSTVYLNKALLELESNQWLAASNSCDFILKNIDKISEELLQRALEAKIYSLVKAKKLKEASVLIEKHHKSFKDDASTQFQNARLKILLGQYITAIAILDKYRDSKEAKPHFLTLWAYQKAGSYDKAIEVYTNKLSKIENASDPVYSDVLIKLAEGAYSKHQAICLEILNKAYTIEKDEEQRAYIILKKAELLVSSDNPQAIEVLKFFLENFKTSSKTALVNSQLSELYKTSKDELLKAEEFATATINSKERNLLYNAYLTRGSTRLKLKKYKEAAQDMKSAATAALQLKLKAEKVAYALYRAGSIEYMSGLLTEDKKAFEQAAKYFSEIVPLDSTYLEKAWLMQAQSLRQSGLKLKAVEVLINMGLTFSNNINTLFLKGICYLEGGEALKGIRALQSFINKAPLDPRSPTAYIESLRAAIYTDTVDKKVGPTLIKRFNKLFKLNPKNAETTKAAPAILHLEAIMLWQRSKRARAHQIWNEFLQKYPLHYLTIEVRLWLGFNESLGPLVDLKSVASHFEEAVALSQDSNLRGFTFLQYADNRYKLSKFQEALETLKKSEDFYRSAKVQSKNTDQLAAVLFFTGDVNSRLGNYDIAQKYFSDAAILSGNVKLKLALKGRLGDCLFSSASKIKISEENKEEYLATLNKAKDCFNEVYKSKEAPRSMKEQALYKLAKCYEAIGLINEKNQRNSALAKAVTHLDKLFSDAQYALESGKKIDTYYFCRAGYDLARLYLTFKDPNYLSAISTYSILAKSGYPGTKDAKALAKEITAVMKLGEK
jgi:tetratricopeptide (TPR) repeat protein